MNNQLAASGLENNIAQTLMIPLYMKSVQSRIPNSFFSDPFACALVDKMDFDFSSFKDAKASRLGCALRTKYFDQQVVDFIGNNRDSVIVNIGCGLDARYERVKTRQTNLSIALNHKSVFYHLDLPEVMTFRETLMPSSSHDVGISASLFETNWMDELKIKHPDSSFLFLIEGVLVYFDKSKVKDFLLELTKRFSDSELVFDASSQWMCDHSHKHDTLKYAAARFKLALDDSKEIERWDPALKVLSNHYYTDFKEWKQAGFFINFMMKLMPQYKNANYIVHARIR